MYSIKPTLTLLVLSIIGAVANVLYVLKPSIFFLMVPVIVTLISFLYNMKRPDKIENGL